MNLNIDQLRRMVGATSIERLYDLLLHDEISIKKSNHPNPINQKSRFYGFSQNDEDSITLEILKRIDLNKGFFVEFGVGNGLENNSIILLSLNWHGAWFGGEDIAFDISNSNKLSFKKVWIQKDNILDLYNSLNKEADVISLDLDGNDIYLAEKLLSNNIFPKLFIIEYNGKFPPNVNFKIEYNPNHTWDGGDYFGASISAFNELFLRFDYKLVCCNLTGSNAFFVKSEYSSLFEDIPDDLNDIYNEPFYFLRNKKMHPTSSKTLERLIKSEI